MPHKRVEQVLDQIARLSPAEQEELARALPRILGRSAEADRLSVAVVSEVLAVRERIRSRMISEGQPLFSIDDELEAMRNERLHDLTRRARSQ